MTANFQTGAEKELDKLKELQPNKPLMTTEFWTGWFDHWLAEIHVTRSTDSKSVQLHFLLNLLRV